MLLFLLLWALILVWIVFPLCRLHSHKEMSAMVMALDIPKYLPSWEGPQMSSSQSWWNWMVSGKLLYRYNTIPSNSQVEILVKSRACRRGPAKTGTVEGWVQTLSRISSFQISLSAVLDPERIIKFHIVSSFQVQTPSYGSLLSQR